MFTKVIAVFAAAFALVCAQNATTVSDDTTTLITVTSCLSDECNTTTSQAIVSIATVTVQGTVTQYTTYCPVTTPEITAPPPSAAPVANATVSSEYEGAAQALPAAGALLAGAAVLLL